MVGIQCENLVPQQVNWVGIALKMLGVELHNVETGNGVFPVGEVTHPTGVTIAGKDNLRILADAGVNFPGASSFISPERN